MEFYDDLVKETKKFLNFVERANRGDRTIAQVYGYEKSKFLLYAMSVYDDKKMLTKIVDGCIKHELWGFLSYLIATYASYDGVLKVVQKNYNRIPQNLRAAFIALLCYTQKWTNDSLNDLLIDLIVQQGCHSDAIDEFEEDEITVYYPLGWNESIEDAINNPCWCLSENDVFRWCLYSKLYYSRHVKEIKNYDMFGEGELRNINTIKTRGLKGKIKKSDILGYIEPDDLFSTFLPLNNVIQNQSVKDIEIMDEEEIETGETDSLCYFLLAVWDGLDTDELCERACDLYDLIIENCEKAGLPEFISSNEVNNKPMSEPIDIAKLVRTRARVTQGDALKLARALVKAQKSAKWVYANSKGYKIRKGYFYRALGYSALKHQVFVTFMQYLSADNLNIIRLENENESFKKYTDIFAIDFDSESKTLEECIKKCKAIANPQKSESVKKEQTVYHSEELTENEKEELRREYIEEVDEEYQKEIRRHAKIADSKIAENLKLKSKMAEMSKQIEDLQRQLEKKQRIVDQQENISILEIGTEPEKYDGETHAMVMSAVRHELNNCEKGTRRHDVLKGVITKNSDEDDAISEKLKEIKSITKGYRNASELKDGLEEQGFEYIDDGKHPKIKYPDDDRYIITAASTSSDVRAGDNLYAQIKKKFF